MYSTMSLSIVSFPRKAQPTNGHGSGGVHSDPRCGGERRSLLTFSHSLGTEWPCAEGWALSPYGPACQSEGGLTLFAALASRFRRAVRLSRDFDRHFKVALNTIFNIRRKSFIRPPSAKDCQACWHACLFKPRRAAVAAISR